MGRMAELHIEMEEDYERLTEEEFLREYGQANYSYIKEFLDPDLKAEDMPEDPHATACTDWTKLDQQIHERDWAEWNKIIS